MASESLSARRAWIEIADWPVHCFWRRSLSARRAWIEIYLLGYGTSVLHVALRKESVDRNIQVVRMAISAIASLSARRAWIEMQNLLSNHEPGACRSPQGERG